VSGSDPVLTVEGLSVAFTAGGSRTRPVEEVSFAVGRGDRFGIVGESGSGKSLTLLAIAGLVDHPGHVAADTLRLEDADLLSISRSRRRAVLGTRMSMILQDPLASLSPVWSVGEQIAETLRRHTRMPRSAAREETIELLAQVGIPDPRRRADSFPHQLSGGMRQRVAIAIAMSCAPIVLLADEPTTALDVSIQAQILDLLVEVCESRGMALVMVTHDLAALSRAAVGVGVMYAGRIVESGSLDRIRTAPAHPYTQALLLSAPHLAPARARSRLHTIPGAPPSPDKRPAGCPFHPRCPYVMDVCRTVRPPLVPIGDGVSAACHLVPAVFAGGGS